MENNSISNWLSFSINATVALIAIISLLYNNKKNSDYIKEHIEKHTKLDSEVESIKTIGATNNTNNLLEHEKLSNRIKVTEEYNNELFAKLDKLAEQMIESNSNMKVIVNHLKIEIK